MLSGGAMATDSLLPDNPAARIMPVQGGGAMPKSNAELSGNRKPAGWHSTPVIIPVSANSIEELNSTPLTLKNYRERWRRTLGPNVPSRHRPRQDPYIVIGSLDITTCPTYVVAPLRGDMDAAKDILFWTNDLLKEDPKAHIVFMGPLTEGGSRADGELILKMLEGTKYEGIPLLGCIIVLITEEREYHEHRVSKKTINTILEMDIKQHLTKLKK